MMKELEQLPIPLLLWYREKCPGAALAERSHAIPGLDLRDHAPADPRGSCKALF